MRPTISFEAKKDAVPRILSGCPNGTVPILRITKGVLHAFKYILNPQRQKAGRASPKGDYTYHVGVTTKWGKFYGAQAMFNIWSPNISHPDQYSMYGISIDNAYDRNRMISIKAGWMVSPELFQDTIPRLFTYWTVDNSQSTGCFNLQCSGFIQTGPVPLGTTVSMVSAYGDEDRQYHQLLSIVRDPHTNNWWLRISFNDQNIGTKSTSVSSWVTDIGYWPKELLGELANVATQMDWGGEAFTPKDIVNGLEIGNGHFPYEGFSRAALIKEIEYVLDEGSETFREPIKGTIYQKLRYQRCFDISYLGFSDDLRWHVFYGGHGGEWDCHY